jgi:hypothetical protein
MYFKSHFSFDFRLSIWFVWRLLLRFVAAQGPNNALRCQFHRHIIVQLLSAQIPKVQEDSQIVRIFLRFWNWQILFPKANSLIFKYIYFFNFSNGFLTHYLLFTTGYRGWQCSGVPVTSLLLLLLLLQCTNVFSSHSSEEANVAKHWFGKMFVLKLDSYILVHK